MDNLGNIFEILASIIGILLYWLLTSRKPKPPKKSSADAERVQPPEPQLSSAESMRNQEEVEAEIEKKLRMQEMEERRLEEEQELHEPEIRSFKELLEQFRRPEREIKQVQELAPEEEEGLPKPVRGAPLKRSEHSFKGTEDLAKYIPDMPEVIIKKRRKSSGRSEHYRIIKKKQNRYGKLLTNPHRVRDIFVAKEIFDTKYF